jgi:gamma-glutamyltranspeptidase/glutathione hydrolase
MVIRIGEGTVTSIDFRETAPGAASEKMYLNQKGEPTGKSLVGALAAGIPGTVAGMALAHERFGSVNWARLLRPAIALARDGHILDAEHEKDLTYGAAAMQDAGFVDSARHYQHPDGRPLRAGERWAQPDLAKTLQMLADRGPDSFYQGKFARQLATRVRELGGIWRARDLARYKAVERKPIVFDYLGHRIISMPPPSSGGVVLRQILGASEILKVAKHPWRSPQAVHLYLEAARRSFADRNLYLGDPDFVDIPIKKLLDRESIAARMQNIDPRKATPSQRITAGGPARVPALQQTTHYSVLDAAGNAVAVTYTLNTGFGAKVVVPGTGVLLNNEMDDFTTNPGQPNVYGLVQGERNRIQPNKRMLSSMTPTIVEREDRVRAVLGSPGGPTIITTVVQLVRALVDHKRPLQEAVNAPRVHHQWLPDRVMAEDRIESDLRRGLQRLGHEVDTASWPEIGHAMCIEVDPESRAIRAVADTTRGGGTALAY